MGRPPIGKVAMSDSERHRRYMTRLRQRAAAATAPALAPPPPPEPVTSLPTPRFADSREPERAGIAHCEELIETGWSFDRIARFEAAHAKTLARHREAEAEDGGS
jgi:hypothetical protein